MKVFQEGVSDWTSRRGRDGPHQHGQFSKSPENLKRRKVGRRISFFFMRWDIHLLDLDIHPACPWTVGHLSCLPLDFGTSISSCPWTLGHLPLLPLYLKVCWSQFCGSVKLCSDFPVFSLAYGRLWDWSASAAACAKLVKLSCINAHLLLVLLWRTLMRWERWVSSGTLLCVLRLAFRSALF